MKTDILNKNIYKNQKGNKNSFLERRSSHNPSFKSSPLQKTIITEADKVVMDVFAQHYGNVGERVGEKLAKLAQDSSPVLRQNARFELEKGITSIKDKTLFRSVAENLLLPFTQLPLWASSSVLKKAQNVPALKDSASKLYKKPILRIPRKLNDMDQRTDIIKGIYAKTKNVIEQYSKEKGYDYKKVVDVLSGADKSPEAQAIFKDSSEFIKEKLYKTSNKFFDKHTGNFNTAYERPLNRIVSGMIPVAFLANDAYNLSVLCGDKKEVSKKEAKDRRNQEISRVLTTAYIQLLTFGAFTKQVNTKPMFAPIVSALTVFVSETTSRLRLGKPVFFLSKESAKKYNEKQKELEKSGGKKSKIKPFGKKDKTAKVTETPKTTETAKQTVKEQKTEQIAVNTQNTIDNTLAKSDLKNTNLLELNLNKTKTSTPVAFKENKSEKKSDEKPQKQQKALFSMSTLKKALAVVTIGGFVVSFIKNSSVTQNSPIMKSIKGKANGLKDKFYNPRAFKDFEIKGEQFDEIMGALKDANSGKIAEGHEFIKNKYAKDVGNGVYKIYQSILPKSGVEEVAKDVISTLNKESKLSKEQIEIINHSIKKAVEIGSDSISEKAYGKVGTKAVSIAKKFGLELPEEQMDKLPNLIADFIPKQIQEKPVQVETKLKPFMDVFAEPFKFMARIAGAPFKKLITPLVRTITKPARTNAAKAELGEATLTKAEKTINKVYTEIFGKEKSKAGKTSQDVFVNAIEMLSKKTSPYINAKKELEAAIKSGASNEVIAAKKAKLAELKVQLEKYVSSSVEKSFNGVTQSSNKNTDLAMATKLFSSLVTSAFLVADNYNMVMIKSNGEDKENAKEKANERIVQRLSALFYQTMLMNWFNSTFRATYNKSLAGMAAVVTPNTITTEVLTRKSIGMPIGRKSYDQLLEIEEKNENRKGLAGKYFKFMRLLTGKKPLKDRMPKDKAKQPIVEQKVQEAPQAVSNNKNTNILDMHLSNKRV